MKKTITAFVASILITSISFQTSVAQTWNITGNAATSSSKLGTTNNVPLKFYTNNTQRMVIDSLGRVGIGTPDPLNIFTVKLNGSSPAASWTNGGSSPAFLAFGENQATGFNLATAADASGYRPVLNTRRSRGTLAAPGAVVNNDYLASFVSSGYDGSSFQNPATIDFYVDGIPSAGSVPGRISFVTGSNAANRLERLKVGSTGNFNFNNDQLFLQQSNGYLGIGTVSPVTKLHVVSPYSNVATFDGGNNMWLTLSENGTPKGYIGSYSGAADDIDFGTYGSNAAGAINFTIQDAAKITIAHSGFVGIGTTTPAYLLDVAGRMRVRSSGGSAGTWFMNVANTADAAFIGMASDTYVGFYGNTGAGWGLAMNTTSGNVGLGTLTPGYKLDVCGTIRAKEVRVETGWCDYVFEKDYKLKSIDELEHFINDNKHLPGIAPAVEVEKEGLKIGEMNKAMMEKIEELTLYVIQLGKENKNLQHQIDSLKK